MTDEPRDIDVPRGIALAWGIAADPQRGPKREMSVERIVEAAIDIADADGIGAVSMAAVASRLGYTPMSLYRYVSAKDDLVLLMQEEATGLPPESVWEREGWRERLRALFESQLQVYLQHPWVIDVPITGSPVTPNSAAHLDAMLRAVADTPLDEAEAVAVALEITGHSRWCGIVLAGYTRNARESGMTPEQITVYEDQLFTTLISAQEYPWLRRAVDAGVFRADGDPFVFGLERILDGVAAYIDRLERSGERGLPVPWNDQGDSAEIAADKRVREARKAVRDAEKALRDARKVERFASRDARERAGR